MIKTVLLFRLYSNIQSKLYLRFDCTLMFNQNGTYDSILYQYLIKTVPKSRICTYQQRNQNGTYISEQSGKSLNPSTTALPFRGREFSPERRRYGGAYRREHCGGDEGIVHLLGTLPVDTRRQQLSDLATNKTTATTGTARKRRSNKRVGAFVRGGGGGAAIERGVP